MKALNCFKALSAALIIAAGVSAQTIWNGTFDTTWYTNNKNATSYTITTAEQLAGLAQLVNGNANNGTYYMSGKTITLGANIMLNDTTNWQNWATSAPANTWTVIGNNSNPFYGTFNGAGYVVGGGYINNESDNQGLFGYVGSGVIRNLGVVASYVKGTFFSPCLVASCLL